MKGMKLLDQGRGIIPERTQLVHELRNRYLQAFFTGKNNQTEIFPLGRTHFALSAHLKDDLFNYYRSKGIQIASMTDKEDRTSVNYFLPSLSPKINIYSGRGTLLEFSDNKQWLRNTTSYASISSV